MKDTQKTYRVTWSIDVEAPSPETAVEVVLEIRPNRGTLVTVPDEVNGTERQTKTYSEPAGGEHDRALGERQARRGGCGDRMEHGFSSLSTERQLRVPQPREGLSGTVGGVV